MPPTRRRKNATRKSAEHHAVEDRADDVDGLDQVLGQVANRAKAIATRPQNTVNHFEAAT